MAAITVFLVDCVEFNTIVFQQSGGRVGVSPSFVIGLVEDEQSMGYALLPGA